MNTVELVKSICKERKIPISKLERDLGYANGYIGQLRKGTFPSNRLAEIAQYLSIPTSYLMNGGNEDEKEQPPRGELSEAKKAMYDVEFCELCRYAQNNRGDIVFYDRFAYLCKQKGVSVSRGALEAGISKSLVTKWKTNNTEIPSPDVIGKLSKYFGLPVSELLGEEPSKTPGETEKAPMPNDIGEENILRMYRSLSTEEKGALYTYALSLKEKQKEGK